MLMPLVGYLLAWDAGVPGLVVHFPGLATVGRKGLLGGPAIPGGRPDREVNHDLFAVHRLRIVQVDPAVLENSGQRHSDRAVGRVGEGEKPLPRSWAVPA